MDQCEMLWWSLHSANAQFRWDFSAAVYIVYVFVGMVGIHDKLIPTKWNKLKYFETRVMNKQVKEYVRHNRNKKCGVYVLDTHHYCILSIHILQIQYAREATETQSRWYDNREQVANGIETLAKPNEHNNINMFDFEPYIGPVYMGYGCTETDAFRAQHVADGACACVDKPTN